MAYKVYIHPPAWREIKQLPGYVKQRIRRAINSLPQNPRPPRSKQLATKPLPISIEARRLRIDNWRIIYAIDEEHQRIHILAIRKRPPYDYNDLEQMLTSI